MYENGLIVTPVPPRTIVDLLRGRAEATPDRLLYAFAEDGEGDVTGWTCGDVDRQARMVAAHLQDIATPGQRVLLLFPPGLAYIAAFFGTLCAGMVAVPAYPPDPVRPDRTLARLLGILRQSGSGIVLTTSTIYTLAEYLFQDLPELRSLRWLAIDTLDESAAGAWSDSGIKPADLALLQYTSGSTAEPKGVMLTHANLMANCAAIQQALGASAESRGVFWLPFYHDMGLIGGVIQPIYCGASNFLMSPLHFLQRPLRWLRAISQVQATHSGGPNFAYDLCVRKIDEAEKATLDLSSWRVAFNGAEPVRAATLARFTAAFASCGFRAEAFYPCYGLAETTVFATGGRIAAPPVQLSIRATGLAQDRVILVQPDEDDGVTLVGVGRPWLDQRVLIVEPDSRQLLADGLVGEIWLDGDSVAQGYWNQPGESARTFGARLAAQTDPHAAGPYLRTGDLGFLWQGELFVTGRIKDLIISDGLNHYPQDIELTVEQSHPSVRPGCCAAFSVEVDGQERLVIAVEVRAPSAGDSGQIDRTIRRAVAQTHDLRVHDVRLLAPGALPKTSSGKIQRHAAKADYLAVKSVVER